MTYLPAENRYEVANFRRCGRSGLDLPAVSLGLWQNFGGTDVFETGRAVLRRAFDRGVTHFDLANNYGPPFGSAESNFGRWMDLDFRPHRDELVISSKAGWDMWPGPYGNHGSRKYLVASCEASLKRMGLDYVDIFYHHRPDPKTPLEESMGALDHLVRSGKALYVGISSYSPELTRRAHAILKGLGTPLLIHQPSYSMLNRWVEGRPARRAAGDRHGLHRLLAAGAGAADLEISRRRPPKGRGPPRAGPSRRAWSRRRTSGASGRSTPSPRRAARRWRRWPSPGCCAIRASPRR